MRYKMIGGDQKEYGPVTAEELRAWYEERRVSGKTLVQPEGGSDWKPLESFPELAARVVPESLKLSGPNLQTQGQWIENRLNRPAALPVFKVIGDACKLVFSNFGGALLATWLMMVLLAVVQVIPIVGSFLSSPLLAGLYWYFIRLRRSANAELEDLFAGFHRGFVAILISGILVLILIVLAAVIVLLPFIFGALPALLGSFAEVSAGRAPNADWLIQFFGLGALFGIVASCLTVVVLFLIWSFVPMLIVDQRLDFWQAMETSRRVSFRVLHKLLLMSFLQSVAVLLSFISLLGWIVIIPICVASWICAYEELFGDKASATD